MLTYLHNSGVGVTERVPLTEHARMRSHVADIILYAH